MKVEPIYRKLGKELATRRAEYQVTQTWLAKKMKVSRPSLANIEQGRQRIYLHQLFLAEKALGYPKGYIIAKVVK